VKGQTVVKLSVVSCPPVVDVLIKRPDVNYALGFSVQNGVVSSCIHYYLHRSTSSVTDSLTLELLEAGRRLSQK